MKFRLVLSHLHEVQWVLLAACITWNGLRYDTQANKDEMDVFTKAMMEKYAI